MRASDSTTAAPTLNLMRVPVPMQMLALAHIASRGKGLRLGLIPPVIKRSDVKLCALRLLYGQRTVRESLIRSNITSERLGVYVSTPYRGSDAQA